MPTPSLHARTANFVRWIRPDPDTVEAAWAQRDDVRARISAKAEDDGLVVNSTPNSGSFAKGTGLRRHMRGGAEHEGQDIDCSFVVDEQDDEGNVLSDLLARFDRYAKECYPTTPRLKTKSSVRLSFVASKRDFDLVPLLSVKGKDDEQILLRGDGERRRTSVQRHVDFTKKRTAKSKTQPGPLTFNYVDRLFKWWREYNVTQSSIIDELPTFLIDLLCAKAFDEVGVRPEWPVTAQLWFDKIASYAGNRTVVAFSDFTVARPEKLSGVWKVIDPVNGENNVVPANWTGFHVDELRDWARESRDLVQQAIAFEMMGRDADAVALLTKVFGPSFKNHSEK